MNNNTKTNISLDQLKNKLFESVTAVFAEDVDALLYFVENANRMQSVEQEARHLKRRMIADDTSESDQEEDSDEDIGVLSSTKRAKTLEMKYNKPGIKSAMQVPSVVKKASNTRKITKIKKLVLKGQKVPKSLIHETVNYFEKETDPEEIDRCVQDLKVFNDDHEISRIYKLIKSLTEIYFNKIHSSNDYISWNR